VPLNLKDLHPRCRSFWHCHRHFLHILSFQ
jgi:hypothetical protein